MTVAAVTSAHAWSLWIPGPLPSLNDLIAAAKGMNGRGTRYAILKRQWKATILRLVDLAKLPAANPGAVAAVSFHWVEANRRRDIDNVAGGGAKLALDSLVAAGVLVDDGWRGVSSITHSFTVDAKRPGVEVSATFAEAAS